MLIQQSLLGRRIELARHRFEWVDDRDFLGAAGAEVPEAARLDQHVVLERADHPVERREGAIHPAAQVFEVLSHGGDAFVQRLAQPADLFGVDRQPLLLPAEGRGPEQRDQRQRAGDDHVLLHAEVDQHTQSSSI